MQFSSSPFSITRPGWKTYFKLFFTQRSILNKLIIINIAVFILLLLVKIIAGLAGFLFVIPELKTTVARSVISLLSCPASFEILLIQPWSIITSLFLHENFWHLLFNMLMLLIVGNIFKSYISEKQLLTTYFIGGICGNLFYILSYNYFPVFQNVMPFSEALGASGSIMAIMFAITIYKPAHEISLILIGRVKLVWIALVFIVIDIASISGSNSGGHLAHLGGTFYGALSSLFYLKYQLFRKKPKKKKMKFATSRGYEFSGRTFSDEEFNATKKEQEKRIDEILDKISQKGYDGLTKEEKQLLFDQRKK